MLLNHNNLNYDLDKYLTIAKDAAVKAGEFLSSNFGRNKKMYHKGGTHFTIKEDAAADKIYKKILAEKSPEVNYYSEESAGKLGSKLTWLVDAIEGTSNYRVGLPFFATQIALVKSEEILLSVVHAPLLYLTYYASKNAGAFRNGVRIKVSNEKKLDKALVSINKGTEIEYLKWYSKTIVDISGKIRTFRNLGATGLELAFVADGKFDVHINYGGGMYDLIPGALLIKEAGGKIITNKAREWAISNDYLIASNKYLSPQIAKIINT